MRYINELDGLRAIAALLVVMTHWIPGDSIIRFFPIGQIGVDVFFTLSGFLITEVLLRARQRMDEEKNSSWRTVMNFYARRALRIFPIYYLLILSTYLFQSFGFEFGTPIAPSFVSFVTYTSNFYMYFRQEWVGDFSHLWSLAVEEQFYLVWPWIVLFVHRNYLTYIILLFVGVGMAGNILTHSGGDPFTPMLTFNCFDAFGFGALLAYLTRYKEDNLRLFNTTANILCVMAIVIFGFDMAFRNYNWFLPLRSTVAIITVWTINYILSQSTSTPVLFTKFLLSNKILIFLGKISYGIYVYHTFVPSFTRPLARKLPFVLPELILLMLNFTLLIAIAWLSYWYIEEPFLRLKKRFR